MNGELPSGRFFLYFNFEPFAAAWAAYRGILISSSTYGTPTFRPIAYWPMGLMRRASQGDRNSLLRLEKELALEELRRSFFPNQVSRLHGIYVWESEADAIRCEEKWRTKEGQHFDRDCLIEIGFTYRCLSRVDTQWIDAFVLDNAVPLDRQQMDWAHRYWSGEPMASNPHWEILVEGRGVVWGNTIRMKARGRVKELEPELLGQLELSRLAAEIGSTLYVVAPFIRGDGRSSSVAFAMDVQDDTPAFMTDIGNRIKSLDPSTVDWSALDLLKSGVHKTPDLRNHGFSFPLDILSSEGRRSVDLLISSRDGTSWSGLTV